MPPRYIGVLSTVRDTILLKRAALLFDEIVCDSVERGVELPKNSALITTGINKLIEARNDDLTSKYSRELVDEIANSLIAQATVLEAGVKAGHLSRQVKSDVAVALYDCVARIYVEPVQLIFPEDVVLPLLRSRRFVSSNHSTRVTVVHVILNAMPIPSDDTPWEAIIEWRADDDAGEKYAQLRAWVARAAKQPLNAADVSDELAAMLASYRHYMSIQHKKLKLGRFEAIIVPIAEVCEDIVHFKLSSAVKRLCGFMREDVQLLEAECRAPGREVAYIAAAETRFGRKP